MSKLVSSGKFYYGVGLSPYAMYKYMASKYHIKFFARYTNGRVFSMTEHDVNDETIFSIELDPAIDNAIMTTAEYDEGTYLIEDLIGVDRPVF